MAIEQLLVTKFSERLHSLHQTLQHQQPDLGRVAIALYDEESGKLSTYAYSSDQASPLFNYAVPLQEVPSLVAVAESGQPRLIQDLNELQDHHGEHTKALLKAGYLASVTIPIFRNQELLGFVFFNSHKVGSFSRFQVPQLEIAAYAVSLLLVQQRNEIITLKATMQSAIEVTHQRNPETGEHLRRIAGYARLVANFMAPQLSLSDEHIEHLVQFSALHDIGKISIPDHILLKPGKLSQEEFAVMQTHTTRGRELVDSLIKNHALETIDQIDMLRNIIEMHHESWDGSGYPHGLRGTDIPIEARIIAVADVFDALTSERPYKDRMASEDALAIINQMRGKKLDPDCVDAFNACREDADRIRAQYAPLDDITDIAY